MDEKEQIPAGIITMLLKGYVETIAFQRKIICAALFGWVATAIAFICMQVGDNKMDTLLKNTRDWLQASTRRSFSAVLEEAKITPRQVEICELKFIKGMTNYQIAAELNVSVKTVDKELNTAYKRITNVLSFL